MLPDVWGSRLQVFPQLLDAHVPGCRILQLLIMDVSWGFRRLGLFWLKVLKFKLPMSFHVPFPYACLCQTHQTGTCRESRWKKKTLHNRKLLVLLIGTISVVWPQELDYCKEGALIEGSEETPWPKPEACPHHGNAEFPTGLISKSAAHVCCAHGPRCVLHSLYISGVLKMKARSA